jgi:hypothetical protein
VFWVRASDTTSFDNAYRNIGQQLGVPGLEDDKADVKRLVKTRLSKENTGNWLMIVDNADDFETFYNDDDANRSSSMSEYLPFSPLAVLPVVQNFGLHTYCLISQQVFLVLLRQ